MTKFKEILAGLVILLVVVLCAVSCRQSIKAWVIHRDVRGYAKIIRGSDMPLPNKITLLDKLDVLDGYLVTSPSVSLSRWREFDGVAMELLTPPHSLGADKLTLLEREIAKLESEIARQRRHYDSVPQPGSSR